MSTHGASAGSGGLGVGQPAVEVLADVERRGRSARLHFETDVGEAEVDFFEGKIVDAYMGDLIGRAALLALIGIPDCRFQVQEMVLAERPAIVPDLATLVTERDQRIADWRALTERGPGLSSVLKLQPSGREALERRQGTPLELVLLGLFDGHRLVTDVIDESGLDAVEGLSVIIELMQRSLVTAGTTQPSLMPAPPVVESLAKLTNVSATAQHRRDPPSESGIALRKRTVIGLGIATAEPVRPKRADVQRIITVTTPPPPGAAAADPAPVPVLPRRRAVEPSAESVGSRVAPRFVGRHEVLGRIGHGGMGSVYLCRLTSETGFTRLFALKILRRHLVEDEAAATKFLEEARLAGQIHHPNVVSVVDAGFDGKQPYLVMDYVEGASLKQLLNFDSQHRPPELILPILLDALSGLHAAHTLRGDDGMPLNVVHCDVSPENLLVGIDGACRLTDFGVARYGAAAATRERIALGKPAYMAPEQVLGAPVDRRADIFAFGVMLYGAITGEKLFEAPTAEETLQRVCGARVVPPSGVGLRPPPSLDFVCMKALERDPNRRFATAEEMMNELRRVALRDNLLAPANAVANWVRQCAGPMLTQRRLSVLDATRKAGGSAGRVRQPSTPAEHDAREDPIDSAPPPSDPNSFSQTMVLPPPLKMRRFALIAAAAVAMAALLITLLAPGSVSRLFHLKTGGFVAPELDATPNPGTAPSSAAPVLPSSQPEVRPPEGAR